MNVIEGIVFAVVFIGGWGFITMYPPKIRTIVFWTMNIVSGIIMLGFLLVLGNHMPWGSIALIFVVVSFAFWLAEKYPRYYSKLELRREIITVWEDFVLFLDTLVIYLGITTVEKLFLK